MTDSSVSPETVSAAPESTTRSPHEHTETDRPNHIEQVDTTRSGGSASVRGSKNESGKPAPTPSMWARIAKYIPGVAVCAAAAALAYGISVAFPGVSAMLVAILLGILVTNIAPLPAVTQPGVTFSAKKLLRIGIVFLGIQLVLGDIISLGAPMLLVVVAIVALGLFGTVWLGKLLKVKSNLALLIACGFSICGAAAVAGASGVTDPNDENEEDTVTAVALVVLFGTLMIAIVPAVVGLLDLSPRLAGMWAGGATHEVAQVVAIGGIIGGGALAAAVIVKLARVLLLAPVIAILSVRQRRITRAAGTDTAGTKLPPIVPFFVIGFLAMVLLRSFVPLPDVVITAGGAIQTALLAAAMFALGLGVQVRKLIKVGLRPFILAALSTIIVAGTAFAGVMLFA